MSGISLEPVKKTVQENDANLTEKRETDMVELLEACKSMASKDEGFIYNYTMVENSKIESIAWSYGDSIRAFSLFGDVVVFDTTYQSITYNMILGVWFGIDNHGKAVFFGCVLLQEESIHSFSWALQAFVQFMRGRQPQTILTDMDIGLRDAIAAELPNTNHVICIWRISAKLSSWFSSQLGLQFEDFKSAFNIVYRLENTEGFDRQWNHLITQFGLSSDKHAALLFSCRASWAFSYVRGHFLAHTMTPDYLKFVDSVLRTILSRQTCLRALFEQVGITVTSMYQRKEEIHYIPTKTHMPIEEHARGILTSYAFRSLQNEIMSSMEYAITEMANGSFHVSHYKKMEEECFLLWLPQEEQIHCSCKEFEHSGILCRHSIRLLVIKNYFQIPERYFPIRWRYESSLVIPMEGQFGKSSNCEYSQAFHLLAANLFSESILSKERMMYVGRELSRVLENVRGIPFDEEVSLHLGHNNVNEV